MRTSSRYIPQAGIIKDPGPFPRVPFRPLQDIEAEIRAEEKAVVEQVKSEQLDIFKSKSPIIREKILQYCLEYEVQHAIIEISDVGIYETSKLESLRHEYVGHAGRVPGSMYWSDYNNTISHIPAPSASNTATKFQYLTYEELLKAHVDKCAEDHLTSSVDC